MLCCSIICSSSKDSLTFVTPAVSSQLTAEIAVSIDGYSVSEIYSDKPDFAYVEDSRITSVRPQAGIFRLVNIIRLLINYK